MANRGRARSAHGEGRRRADEEAGDAPGLQGPRQPDRQTEMFRELIEELRTDRQRDQPAPREAFKAPSYDGVGSIEVFIRHFLDVAEANQWGEGATVLHLRRALKDEARDCGGAGEDIAEIFTALRARFGISPREARAKLNSLKKDYATSLQTHASRVKELVGIAYQEMPRGLQDQLVLEQFINTLNHAGLQRHLLAVRPEGLTEAVTAGGEYLQVKNTYTGVKQLELEGEEEGETEAKVMPVYLAPSGRQQPALPAMVSVPESTQPVVTQPAVVQPTPMPAQPGPFPPMLNQQAQLPLTSLWNGNPSDPMAALMATMAQLAQGFQDLQQKLSANESRRGLTCWGCGKTGHTRAQCRAPKKTTENKEGQQ